MYTTGLGPCFGTSSPARIPHPYITRTGTHIWHPASVGPYAGPSITSRPVAPGMPHRNQHTSRHPAHYQGHPQIGQPNLTQQTQTCCTRNHHGTCQRNKSKFASRTIIAGHGHLGKLPTPGGIPPGGIWHATHCQRYLSLQSFSGKYFYRIFARQSVAARSLCRSERFLCVSKL